MSKKVMTDSIKELWMSTRHDLVNHKKEWEALDFDTGLHTVESRGIVNDVLSIIAAQHAAQHAAEWTMPQVTKDIARL